jgi:hypothetical protein
MRSYSDSADKRYGRALSRCAAPQDQTGGRDRAWCMGAVDTAVSAGGTHARQIERMGVGCSGQAPGSWAGWEGPCRDPSGRVQHPSAVQRAATAQQVTTMGARA